ncbi:MAG: gamma-glutamyltransferase [Phycisphaerales bacterium]|nr:gamma-glutamyltransferase [Phycisphaerales bacterium]
MMTPAMRPTALLLMLILLPAGCQSPESMSSQPATGSAADQSTIQRPDNTRGQVSYANGAVAADSPVASQAGVTILKAGGNAVDAAVATGFALAVTRPFSCGIGGGGFMIVYDPEAEEGQGKAWALDYRETAPARVDPDYYAEQAKTASGYRPSLYGGRASGVPGEIPGLLAAHSRWGTLDLPTILAPAIAAATDGFEIDASYLGAIRRVEAIRRKHPDLRPVSQWLWEHLCGSGKLAIGDRLRQPELAAFLKRLAEFGLDAWNGPGADTAAPLVAGVNRAYDGMMSVDDVQNYAPRWRQPIIVRDVFQDYDALLMPPPSSGGVVMAQVMQMLQLRLDELDNPPMDSPAFAHLFAEALKHGFADRARYLADPDFAPVPIDELRDPERIKLTARSIDLTKTQPTTTYGVVAPPPADSGTSHYSVIDSNGMTVAATETINGTFGSLLVIPEIGVVMNNEMDDFTTIRGEANLFGLRQSDWNLPEPGKRPLSSMSPTILLRNGETAVTAGASGGPRIITGTLQVLLRIIYEGRTPVDAVSAPRIHHQWLPENLLLEEQALHLQPSLEAYGHDIKTTGGVGVVQAIRVHEDGFQPASDPRKGGQPAGY